MSEEFTNFVNSSRPRARLLTCIAHAPVRNARGVPESVGVSRESKRSDRLLKRVATSYRISVVFAVGGPLVYQRQTDHFV
jgi:hypothetical protein